MMFTESSVGKGQADPATGQIVQVNAAFCRITGYSEEELRRRSFLEIHHPDDRERTIAAFDAMVRGEISGYQQEKRYLRPDGSVVWVDVVTNLIRDRAGRPFRSFTVIQDVTERKRAEEALKQQSARLEAANKELESFSYSVSHDLRAPLRAITGYSQMILKRQGEQFDEETRRRFRMITDNAEKMGRLIDDLLAFSRLGSQAVAKLNLNMEELTGEAWEELVTIHPDREMTLKIEKMPLAWGDRALIRQVYSNLLGNAVKFTRAEGRPLIAVGSCIQDGEAAYYVRDNGIGFDMKWYDKLFGVFQRLHGDEEYKGTGIGLALIQRIINRHGGRVWAEGEVDKGATFYFTLPSRQE